MKQDGILRTSKLLLCALMILALVAVMFLNPLSGDAATRQVKAGNLMFSVAAEVNTKPVDLDKKPLFSETPSANIGWIPGSTITAYVTVNNQSTLPIDVRFFLTEASRWEELLTYAVTPVAYPSEVVTPNFGSLEKATDSSVTLGVGEGQMYRIDVKLNDANVDDFLGSLYAGTGFVVSATNAAWSDHYAKPGKDMYRVTLMLNHYENDADASTTTWVAKGDTYTLPDAASFTTKLAVTIENEFSAWNDTGNYRDKDDATAPFTYAGNNYNAGETITVNENITLYAVWVSRAPDVTSIGNAATEVTGLGNAIAGHTTYVTVTMPSVTAPLTTTVTGTVTVDSSDGSWAIIADDVGGALPINLSLTVSAYQIEPRMLKSDDVEVFIGKQT